MNLTQLKLEMYASWIKRSSQERRIISVFGLLILISMIYLIGFDPALKNIDSLEKSYPVLKQQTAKMTVMSQEYAIISQSLSENIPAVTRQLIESSLLRKNIQAQSLSVSNEIVRVQSNLATYNGLMEWLLEMQKAARLSVEDAKVTALSTPGQVSFVITLRQQRIAQ